MRHIYLDNGATSFPKAPNVGKAMADYVEHVGMSVNRSFGTVSRSTEQTVYALREALGEMFNYPKASHVIFTKNITESINVILKGFVKEGMHIVTSHAEHNAVLRPLRHLEASHGIKVTFAPVDNCGRLELSALEDILKTSPDLMICTHGSNVTGAVNDIEAIGKMAHDHGVAFVIDAAQTAGELAIDFEKCHLSALTFTGHKSLLGPQGMGGFIISDAFSKRVDSFIQGGTGSLSELETQPELLPDKYEAGTPNLPGIYGLLVAIEYIQAEGIAKMHDYKLRLARAFAKECDAIDGIRTMGFDHSSDRTAVVSIAFDKVDPAEVTFVLSNEYNITTRVGMHCAPLAHKAIGSFPYGTLRFSFSYFNTQEEVDFAIKALKNIVE